MLYRLVFICFGLGCFTTLIAIQQTHRYRFHYEEIISDLYQQLYEKTRGKYKLESLQKSFSLVDRSYTLTAEYTERALIDKYYADLENSKDFNVGESVKQPTSDLLIPVLFYNMGPNNLFRIFKETISLAISMNRTLVVPPFHHHPRMEHLQQGQKAKDVMSVDIFDQTYKSAVETEAEKTLDFRALQRLIPAVSIKDFHSKCGKKIDTVITCGSLVGKRTLGLKHFEQVLNVSIGRLFPVENFRDVIDDKKLKVNLLSSIHKIRNEKCVGLALGTRCLGSRRAWFRYWKPYSKYVRRPAKIKVLAKEFIKAVFRDEQFLAVHWRYENEDWQDMCKQSRPDAVRKINKPMCDMAIQLVSNSSLLDSVATRLHTYATEKNLTYIYFAAPPQLIDTLKKLKTRLSDIFIISDLLKFATINNLMIDVFDNNFSVSFLEQEIAYQAAAFLGSPLSSWTQTVILDRALDGRDEYESVLDVLVKDSTPFPKLMWYFPEGS